MANRYFFDKRDIKHFLLKYGIMLLICIPLLILVNFLFVKWFGAKNMVLLDIVFLCVIFVVYEAIWYAIKRKKGEKNTHEK